jgi:hypothetical protein
MSFPTTNLWPDNGKGASGTPPAQEKQKDQIDQMLIDQMLIDQMLIDQMLIDESLVHDEHEVIIGIAQYARVVRTPPNISIGRSMAVAPLTNHPQFSAREAIERPPGPVLGRSGSAAITSSPILPQNTATPPTTPPGKWTAADSRDGAEGFLQEVTEVMNKLTLCQNELLGSTPLQNVADFSRLTKQTLVSPSVSHNPNSPVNGSKQPSDAVDTHMVDEDYVFVSNPGRSRIPLQDQMRENIGKVVQLSSRTLTQPSTLYNRS